MTIPRALRTRMLANVAVAGRDACWPWLASCTSRGYGQVKHQGRVYGAHRLAWQLANRRPPRGSVLHRCDNPPCCNPAHLYEGGHARNLADARERGLLARTPAGTFARVEAA